MQHERIQAIKYACSVRVAYTFWRLSVGLRQRVSAISEPKLGSSDWRITHLLSQ